MAGRKRRTSNRNRQQNGQTIKRVKRAERSTEPMKITDLNYDCLEKVFRNLDLDNLIKIADSNKTLAEAACTYFRLKYGQKHFWIYANENSIPPDDRPSVFGLKKSLQLLRCFGCEISQCFLDPSGNTKYCTYFNQYLDEYCTESLKVVGFRNFPTLLQNMKNRFSEVQIATLGNC